MYTDTYVYTLYLEIVHMNYGEKYQITAYPKV
jgi:hypothetical protein